MVISWCVARRTKVSTFLPVSWECPGRPSGHVVGSSQDPNINLLLYLFPADQPWCLVCSRVFPSLALRWRRRRRRWKGKSLFSPAAAPSSLIDVILSCSGAEAWKHTRDWKSAADVFTHTSYVPFPCGRSPELHWLPCALRGPHNRLCRQRTCALSVFKLPFAPPGGNQLLYRSCTAQLTHSVIKRVRQPLPPVDDQFNKGELVMSTDRKSPWPCVVVFSSPSPTRGVYSGVLFSAWIRPLRCQPYGEGERTFAGSVWFCAQKQPSVPYF